MRYVSCDVGVPSMFFSVYIKFRNCIIFEKICGTYYYYVFHSVYVKLQNGITFENFVVRLIISISNLSSHKN